MLLFRFPVQEQLYQVVPWKIPDAIGSSKLYVKRVIGLPGETVQIKEGHIYINGNLLENDINDTYIVTAGITANEIHLAEDEYFCLGDNRNNSERR